MDLREAVAPADEGGRVYRAAQNQLERPSTVLGRVRRRARDDELLVVDQVGVQLDHGPATREASEEVDARGRRGDLERLALRLGRRGRDYHHVGPPVPRDVHNRRHEVVGADGLVGPVLQRQAATLLASLAHDHGARVGEPRDEQVHEPYRSRAYDHHQVPGPNVAGLGPAQHAGQRLDQGDGAEVGRLGHRQDVALGDEVCREHQLVGQTAVHADPDRLGPDAEVHPAGAALRAPPAADVRGDECGLTLLETYPLTYRQDGARDLVSRG